MPRSVCFTPKKENRYPFYRGLYGPQHRSRQVRKISQPPGFDPRNVHPVASRYTVGAIPALFSAWYPLYFQILFKLIANIPSALEQLAPGHTIIEIGMILVQYKLVG